MPSFPKEETNQRISHLRAKLAQGGHDAALLVQDADLYYFSGTAQDCHLLIPAADDPVLMVRKDLSRANDESSLSDIRPVSGYSDIEKIVTSTLGGRAFSLGMELDVLPANNYFRYQKLFPKASIGDISTGIKEIRMIKSALELSIIRRAAQMNDTMFGLVKDILREGMSEMEFSGLLEAQYRRLGHQGTVRVRAFNNQVFYGHVMSGTNLAVPSCSVGPTGGPGPNPSMPHGAGHKKISRNEPIQIDYVGVVEGYMVDQARTFYLGKASKKLSRIHEKALEIQDTIASEGKPGAKAEDLYNIAMEMAEKAGFSRGFLGFPQPVPFVGHGVGLELDEFPVIGRKSPHVLEQGMVIALEPKFIAPGEGLAGIENTYVVSDSGMEKLTRFDDQIQVLG
jgi:Xaa-Pro aminopeptidase